MVCKIKEGDCFGEVALTSEVRRRSLPGSQPYLQTSLRSATIRTLKDCVFLTLEKEPYLQVVQVQVTPR